MYAKGAINIKLSILSSLAFNKKICIENVYREGITAITKEDIAQGKEMGYTLKLLGIGKDTDNGVEVRTCLQGVLYGYNF